MAFSSHQYIYIYENIHLNTTKGNERSINTQKNERIKETNNLKERKKDRSQCVGCCFIHIDIFFPFLFHLDDTYDRQNYLLY